MRQIAFLIVPSAMAFLALGSVVAAAVYQSGRFTHGDSIYVWATLAGSAVGLLAATLGRLYSSAFYALHDTKTPLRIAVVRVVLTTTLGYVFALELPGWLHIDISWGVAGLTSSAGLAAWLEFSLLRRSLNRRIGRTGLKLSYLAKLWSAALIAAAIAWVIKITLPPMRPLIAGALILFPYCVIYLGITIALRVPESAIMLRRFQRK